ncbi:NAD(P)H-binding protein [Halorubellus sp. JP-L1]|uniref:SDR family oxidoreductase n=1 Tax=Halorubellus sp. JP-L1 TaxID=2715753 RepID=UPI00140C5D05|nr:NAD-dependent epimerase/dehydratase family protein [Halorubellus sp. JP-L1]NHN40472.1 NAD(P)H-binding protein [Halorubellus sp. JP-L1]
MVRTLVTGATGTLGAALVPRLREAGHDVRATSRSPPADGSGFENEDLVEWVAMDLADGTGVADAVADVDVVVHAATAPTGDTEAVDVDGTERLLDAATEAGVSNVVYPSIVGIEDVPYSYYRHKLAAEELVEAAAVPTTVVRATQFHQFLDELLGLVARSPVWPLPTKFRVQPVDARAVANAVVANATPEARGRVPPVCGPEVLSVREIAAAYRQARALRRLVVRVPIPGAVASAFRAGDATCGPSGDDTDKISADDAPGPTWGAWLAETYGASRSASASRTSTT